MFMSQPTCKEKMNTGLGSNKLLETMAFHNQRLLQSWLVCEYIYSGASCANR